VRVPPLQRTDLPAAVVRKEIPDTLRGKVDECELALGEVAAVVRTGTQDEERLGGVKSRRPQRLLRSQPPQNPRAAFGAGGSFVTGSVGIDPDGIAVLTAHRIVASDHHMSTGGRHDGDDGAADLGKGTVGENPVNDEREDHRFSFTASDQAHKCYRSHQQRSPASAAIPSLQRLENSSLQAVSMVS
jgi:hypothetical protein